MRSMKIKFGYIACVLAVITAIFFLPLTLIDASAALSFSISDDNAIIQEPRESFYVRNYANDTSNRSGMKTVSMKIEGMTVTPSFKGMIYPTVDTVLKVSTSNGRPETVKISFDSQKPDHYIRYSRTEGFRTSDVIKEQIYLIQELSKISYNSSLSLWEVDFGIVFEWSYPSTILSSIKIIATDEKGYLDEFSIQQTYIIERNLVLDGEVILSSTDPGAITKDLQHIRGNAYLVITGISLHFQNNIQMSPDPKGLKMGIFDDRGNYWEYIANGHKDLRMITFSFQVPNMDGITHYSFLVHTMPEMVKVDGKVEFSIIIDSTSPKIWGFKIKNDAYTKISWNYQDESSGIDFGSLRIRLVRSSPSEIIEWYKPENVRWFNDMVEIILDLTQGDYHAQIILKDNVGNVNPYEATYYFSTMIMAVHDISVDGTPYTYPSILIAGYETQVHYTITNRGSFDEEDIDIHFFIDNKLHDIFILGDLPAGSTREIRFTFRPSLENIKMRLTIDPNQRIMDEDPSNNEIVSSIKVHFRDINIDKKSFTPSNSSPYDMEQITINLRVNNIGDLDSGTVKIIFLEDDRFHGEYHIRSIPGGSWDILSLQWKANFRVTKLSFIVDPYNEIFESDENNRFDIDNPFYSVPSSSDSHNEEEEVIYDDNTDAHYDIPYYAQPNLGKTIWIGPITDSFESPQTLDTEIKTPDPPSSGEQHGIPLITIPLLGFTITTTMIAGILLVLKNEPLRFKMMMMAIPLYSKLKKTKIEHGTRFEILGYLKARPGANYTELKENLDLNDGALMHHVRILEREEKIYSKRVGKYKLFYVTSYRREPSLSDYISPVQKRILELIYQNPGIVPKSLSGILDRSQTDISYHLTELSRNGYLEKKKKGKNIHYYLRDEYMESILS